MPMTSESPDLYMDVVKAWVEVGITALPPRVNAASQWGDCLRQSHSDYWWLEGWEFWSSSCDLRGSHLHRGVRGLHFKNWVNLWCPPANPTQGKEEGGVITLC